jgi:hypothetical protein
MMAKRFTDTQKWTEDWYLDLPIVYKIFWIYICDNCNHAGVYKPNKRVFELLVGEKIDLEKFLEGINRDKERIIKLANGRWYLTGFIEFQYGTNLNPNNRVHRSILKLLNENDLNWEGKELQPEVIKAINNTAKPSSISEIVAYFESKGSNKKEAEKFYYFYESNGWKVGKNPMKEWKMAASGWISRNKKEQQDPGYLGGQLKAMKG